MSDEKELKFAVVGDVEELRRRLVEVGAKESSVPSEENNWVFDRHAELYSASRLLRLRSDGQGGHLTYKGPPRFEGGLKVREEIEVDVDDVEATRNLLVRLGYRVVRRYQKIRQEWRLDSTVVAVDLTPIGLFVEFEGEDAPGSAKQCGFDPEQAEKRSYLRLYEEHRREHPHLPPDMVFP